jgi:hypothetical protein
MITNLYKGVDVCKLLLEGQRGQIGSRRVVYIGSNGGQVLKILVLTASCPTPYVRSLIQ